MLTQSRLRQAGTTPLADSRPRVGFTPTRLLKAAGTRPVFGGDRLFQTDPHWRDHILFYEYFHGDNGAGIGASHQTGWTALVANLLQEG